MANTDQYQRKVCRYCDSSIETSFLDLGNQPLANSFLSADEVGRIEFKCPLRLGRCASCGLVQLSHVVPAAMMFSNYLYVSSTTKTFRDHFAHYARNITETLIDKTDAVAIDIGSNDGLLVDCYNREGLHGIGIEPATNLSEEANKKGIKTINRYFDEACVSEIIDQYGHASVVSANNVFAHIDDVQSVCRNVSSLLKSDGIFVLEFPYLLTMMEEMLFDMIYHEHLSYISVASLRFLFHRFNFEIFNIDYTPSHGGSLRVFAQKKGGPYKIKPSVAEYLDREKVAGMDSSVAYEKFASAVATVKTKLIEMLMGAKEDGKNIVGYGAPAKASTLINYCNMNPALISYIVDDNPLKQGRYTPGVSIPIHSSDQLNKDVPDYILIFAWNFANEILKKLTSFQERGVKFLVPLPTPQFINAGGSL